MCLACVTRGVCFTWRVFHVTCLLCVTRGVCYTWRVLHVTCLLCVTGVGVSGSGSTQVRSHGSGTQVWGVGHGTLLCAGCVLCVNGAVCMTGGVNRAVCMTGVV